MKRLTVLTVLSWIVVCLIFTGQSIANVDSKNFLGIYLLDEGGGNGTKDSSGNGNDGKFIGNPQWVGGKFGKALSFSGQNDYVEIADSDGLDIKKAITLMAWVYPTKLSKNVEGIIAKWRFAGENERSYLLATSETNNGIRFQLSPDGTGASEKVLFSDVGLEMNKWTHIACVWDGSTMKVYFDGVEHGSLSYNQDIHAGKGKVDIGTLNEETGANRVFDGIIDEAAILNIALTKEEVNDLMTKGLKSASFVSSLGKLAATWGGMRAKYWR